eukprot:Nk52_evm8s1837 gene=Nk52_evmTU8s1837
MCEDLIQHIESVMKAKLSLIKSLQELSSERNGQKNRNPELGMKGNYEYETVINMKYEFQEVLLECLGRVSKLIQEFGDITELLKWTKTSVLHTNGKGPVPVENEIDSQSAIDGLQGDLFAECVDKQFKTLSGHLAAAQTFFQTLEQFNREMGLFANSQTS